MDWKSVGKQLIGVGLPLLGNAIIPGSGTAIALVANALGLGSSATPEQVATAIGNPDNVLKLKELQDKHEETLAKMAYDAENAAIESVNKTMQAEAAAAANENWWQKGWRPFNGYVIGVASFVSVVGVFYLAYLALAGKDPAALNILPSIVTSIAMVLAIPGAAVGITAWHRGLLQREQAKG